MGRASKVDLKNEKTKKGSKPKKTAGAVNAKAEENNGKAAAAEKPPKRSAAEKAAEKAAKKEKEEKEAGKGARKALRNAVKKVVKAGCEKIALRLLEETEKGNMRSTSMMLSLMEKKKDKDGEYDGPSEAELLGSEEQWEDESALARETTSEVAKADGRRRMRGRRRVSELASWWVGELAG